MDRRRRHPGYSSHMVHHLEAVNGSLKAWRNLLEYELSGTSGDGGSAASLHFLNNTSFAKTSDFRSRQCVRDARRMLHRGTVGLARREMRRIGVEFARGSSSGSRRELMKSGRVAAGSSHG